MDHGPLTIWYHGTNKYAASMIRKRGFNTRAYFARNLADALEFGGRYVFEVSFPDMMTEQCGWQFRAYQEDLEASEIISLTRYDSIPMFEDPDARVRVEKSNENV